MGISYGITTKWQATKGVVQDGLILNLDAGVKDSYNGGATWRDLAADNNLTLYNSPKFQTNNGGGFQFDGTDDYGDFSSFDITGGNNYTISIVLSRDYSISGYRYILDDSNGASGFGIRMPHGNSHGLECFAYDSAGGAASILARTNVFTSSDIYYLTFVFRTSSIDSYINGGSKQSKSGIPNNIKASSTPTRLAANSQSGSERWLGKIYSVRIYNRVLSDTEILQNYNVMRHRFGI